MPGQTGYLGFWRLGKAYAEGRDAGWNLASSTSPHTANNPADVAWDAGYAAGGADSTTYSPKPWTPLLVTFDGTNDYLAKSSLDLSIQGAAKWFLISFTIKMGASSDGTAMRIIESNLPSGAILIVNRNASNKLAITLRDSGGTTTKALVLTTTDINEAAGTKHILWGVNVDTGATTCYINDTAETTTNTTLLSGTTWGNGAITDLGIGAAVAGTSKLKAQLADLWVTWDANSEAYPDLTNVAFRRLFVNPDGTGAQPRRTLTGPTSSTLSAKIFMGGTQTLANWNAGLNQGYSPSANIGTPFTVTGALT